MDKSSPDEVENQVNSPNSGFVKMVRSPDILELIETAPLAFTLATVIALRARFKPGMSLKGLHPGEAFLGDYKRCGLSERQYRTAKQQLAKWQFATFRATNKGTVARLIDTRLFDVLNLPDDRQGNGQPSGSRRQTKNVKTGKNGKKKTATGDGSQTRPHLPSSKRFPFSVQEVLDFADRNGLDDVVALRFIRYNNGRWSLENWRGALLAFNEACMVTGASEIPADWLPKIIPPATNIVPDEKF